MAMLSGAPRTANVVSEEENRDPEVTDTVPPGAGHEVPAGGHLVEELLPAAAAQQR